MNTRTLQGNMRAMSRPCFVSLLSCLALSVPMLAPPLAVAATPEAARVTGMRLWADAEGTRLVLDLSRLPRHEVFTLDNPHRIVVDLERTALAMPASLPPGQGVVQRVRTGVRPEAGLRVVLDLSAALQPRSFTVAGEAGQPARLVVELDAAGSSAPSSPAAPIGSVAVAAVVPAASDNGAAREPVVATGSNATSKATAANAAATPNVTPTPAPPPAPPVTPTAVPSAAKPVKAVPNGDSARDLVIAIDAGHGGKDPGAHGKAGTREKDITLAVARRLAKLIDAEDGMRAVLVRDSDHFLTLRTRIRKAREANADMFISVHADSARNREAKGSSVYVLSTRGASDEAARWLAEGENAADLIGGVSLDEATGDLASVLLDVAQEESLNSSIEAARRVLESLGQEGRLLRTRVQHAGFVVLKSPDIPSMLVETAFLSNASDETALRNPAHQQRLAAAIHRGVKRYFYDFPPPGTRVATLAMRVDLAGGGSAAGTSAGH